MPHRNIFKTDSVPKTGALTNSGAITKLDQALTSGTLTNSGSTTLSRILSQIAAAVLTTTGALLNTIAISKTSAVTYIGATHVNHSTRIHVAVDPWDSDSYPTLMRRRTTTRLSMMADAMNLDLLILPWQDTEFFALCAAGVPFHAEPESGGGRAAPSAPGRLRSPLITTYSFVHIDAEHTVPAVSRAIDFFVTRTSLGGYWVFDDIHSYLDTPMEDRLTALGFTTIERGANRLSVRKDK